MDENISQLLDKIPESTVHDVAQNIMDEPIPEEVKRKLLKPLLPRKPRPSPAPHPSIKARERKRKAIVREFNPNFPSKALRTTADYQQVYDVAQNIIGEPIPEEVKKRLLKPLLPRKPQPSPPPRPSKKARERKRKAIVREFDPNFPSKALRTTADYQQEILNLFDVASNKKIDKLAFRQTAWAIGSFLRGWQMDVPKRHPLGADPKAFLVGLRPQIYNKLEEQIRALNGIKFQLALKVQLRKTGPDGTEEYTDPVFRHKQEAIIQPSEIDGALDKATPPPISWSCSRSGPREGLGGLSTKWIVCGWT